MKLRARLSAALFATLALFSSVHADEMPLSAEQESRYRGLLVTLRCLVCQNETLQDSDAPLAADLRAQIRARVARGESDADIRRYLTDRYGDFVLYKPPLQPNTWLLWGGPFLLLLTGLGVAFAFVRRSGRRAATADVDAEALRRLLEEEK
jgi:cytochrome c-type biogenesis protein CcmH